MFIRTDAAKKHICDGQTLLTLPLGGKARLQNTLFTTGGGANNTAVSLARLGCTATCLSVIGDDEWGGFIIKTMKKEGVSTDSLTIVEGEPSSFSLIFSADDGERVILVEPGTGRHLRDVTLDVSALRDLDLLYLNHIHRESCDIIDNIVSVIRASSGTRLAWNPGGNQIASGIDDPCNADLLKQTHILLLNKEEALAFAKTATVDDALRALHATGAAIICVTDGAGGVAGYDGKLIERCTALPCAVVDVTGAGDAFGSAFSWGILQGYDLLTAMNIGTMNATSVIGSVGAQPGLLTSVQILDRLCPPHTSPHPL